MTDDEIRDSVGACLREDAFSIHFHEKFPDEHDGYWYLNVSDELVRVLGILQGIEIEQESVLDDLISAACAAAANTEVVSFAKKLGLDCADDLTWLMGGADDTHEGWAIPDHIGSQIRELVDAEKKRVQGVIDKMAKLNV